jgi:hypothetical protein
MNDGFGGFSASMAEAIQEEYPKKSLLAYASQVGIS